MSFSELYEDWHSKIYIQAYLFLFHCKNLHNIFLKPKLRLHFKFNEAFSLTHKYIITLIFLVLIFIYITIIHYSYETIERSKMQCVAQQSAT